jgi:hypothetical protein
MPLAFMIATANAEQKYTPPLVQERAWALATGQTSRERATSKPSRQPLPFAEPPDEEVGFKIKTRSCP